jgi:cytochrome c-type biogenesis protein CcmH/NrfG
MNGIIQYAHLQADSSDAGPAMSCGPLTTSLDRADRWKKAEEPEREGEETAQGLIFKYETQLRHGPNNHQVLKMLGALYARESDFDHWHPTGGKTKA